MSLHVEFEKWEEAF